MSTATDSPHPERPGSRWRLPLAAAAIAIVFVVFRVDAFLRVQGPLIADSTEYLSLARDLATDSTAPVQPVRNCFFSAMVAGQFLVQGWFSDGPLDPATGRVLPFLFHILAVLGAGLLAREIHSWRAGAIAALLVGVLPAFGYWATDCLTDVPAAACIVWSVLCWVRGKPLASGLLMGIGVLLRYQAIVCLLGFLGIVVLSRPRRRLIPVGLGLLVVPLGLLVLDAAYWGEPFLSIRGQFGIFADHLGSSLDHYAGDPAGPDAAASAGIFQTAYGVFSKAIHSDFVVRAHQDLTWIVIALFASYGLARRWASNRRAGDATFGICLSTYALLCFLTDDDLRYLVSITPLVAAIGAASAVPWIERTWWLTPRHAASTTAAGQGVELVVLGVAFAGIAWNLQGRLRYAPYGATLDALDASRATDRARLVAVSEAWIPAHEHAIADLGAGTWNTAEGLRIADLAFLDEDSPHSGDERRTLGLVEGVIRELDDLVVAGWNPKWEAGSALWRHLNRRAVFDRVFFRPGENLDAAWQFRIVDPELGERPFWEIVENPAFEEEPLAVFRGEVSLLEIELVPGPGTPDVFRADFYWEIDASVTDAVRAITRIDFGGEAMRPPDWHYVLPPQESRRRGIATPGDTVRVSRYYELFVPAGARRFYLNFSLVEESASGERRDLRLLRFLRSCVSAEKPWQIRVEVPIPGDSQEAEGR